MQKIKINKINSSEFSEFIKKLLSVDKFIYIKLNNEKIISNVYLPQRDAVKLQQIPVSQLFEINDKALDTLKENNLKVSFYNGNKLIEALKMFNENLSAVITYTETDSSLIAESFMLYDENLKIKILCADPAINFMDLTDDQINGIFDLNNLAFEFELKVDDIDNMNMLFNFEKDKETFDIILKDNIVSFKGDNYIRVIGAPHKSNIEEHIVKIYKKHLSLVDKEYYTVSVLQDKIILNSIHSDTRLSIAKCNI